MNLGRRVAESMVVAMGGAVVAGGTWGLVGATVPAAVVGGVSGALAGWRGTYDWGCSTGFVAFVLDSSWAIPMTATAVFANGVAFAQRSPGFVPELSHRRNRHVYRRGFVPRRGFAITLGNTICGAGDVGRPRRRRLITDHEDVHCWQARWLGPLFPVLYVGWMAAFAVVGVGVWAVSRRDEKFTKVVESTAYYLNPLEWWAYSRDDHWPPAGKVEGLGWKHPCCKPLTTTEP